MEISLSTEVSFCRFILMSLQHTFDKVLVGDTDGAESITGHWFNHIAYHLILIFSSERMWFAITAKGELAPAK
jgi:hypothetical protein